MSENILNINSIKKSFMKNNSDERSVLKDISFSAEKGKITALIGGNGTGKTTLFNIISGFIKPDTIAKKSSISFNKSDGSHINLIKKSPNKIAQIGIGRMFQDNHIFPNMSIIDNMLVAYSKENKENKKKIKKIIEKALNFLVDIFKNDKNEKIRIEKALKILINIFEVDNSFWVDVNTDTKRNNSSVPIWLIDLFPPLFKNRKLKYLRKYELDKASSIEELLKVKLSPQKIERSVLRLASSLSYGQKRLLGLARLLMGNYSLLLLDEPTSGVNPILAKKISRLIKEIVKTYNISVLLIEHDLDFVKETADYCFFISGGVIAAEGTPDEVINNSEVRKKYLGY